MDGFNWWLLVIGVVAGGLLTWIVLADSTRRDREITERETAAEAGWIARTLDDPRVDATVAEDVLRAHRRYLGYPPPDVLVAPDELTTLGPTGVATEPPAGQVVEMGGAAAPTPHEAGEPPDDEQPDPARSA